MKSPKKENGEVPQVYESRADVEQATEAPQQRQQQQLSTGALLVSEQGGVQSTQPRTAEQVVDVPDVAAQSTQQRTAQQVVDVPDETEPVQQLDREPLDVTAKSGAREGCPPLQREASDEPCDSSWKESGSRRKQSTVTGLPALFLRTTSENDAIESRH